jgi:hypothetical protein
VTDLAVQAAETIDSLREQLAQQRATFLDVVKGQREAFERTRPLCSGHVDKMSGECLGCRLGRAESALATARREAQEAMEALRDLWDDPAWGDEGRAFDSATMRRLRALASPEAHDETRPSPSAPTRNDSKENDR